MRFEHKLLSKVVGWISRVRYKGRIFLSFSNSDREKARRIASALKSQHFLVFFDEDNLPAGADFNARVEAALNGSDAVVFLLSPDFLEEGRYSHAELMLAETKWPVPEGHVLAVEVEPVDASALPAYLSPISMLRPKGPVATEVTFAVNRLRGWSAQRRFAAIRGVVLSAIVGVLSWMLYEAFDQRNMVAARNDVVAEVRSNANVINDLNENAATLANTARTIAESLRHPNIQILATLFPYENINPIDLENGRDERPDLYNKVIDQLAVSGLVDNQTEVSRATEACRAITRTIERTRTVAASMADIDTQKYLVTTERWDIHRALLFRDDQSLGVKVSVIYDQMRAARRDYDRVAAAVLEYHDATYHFCTDLAINRSSMSEVLAAERLAFDLLVTHLANLTITLEAVMPSLKELSDESSGAQVE